MRASTLAASVECYIHHSIIDEILTVQKKTDILRTVGSIYTSLERIHSNTIKLSGEPENINLKNTIEGEKNSLKDILTDLPSFIWLETLNLSCGAEFFFEALCCGVREGRLKQQNYLFKAGTTFRISLEKEINILKQAPVEKNRNQINLKERALALHNEETIRNEVLENKKFEMLNNEKMTPYFLSLVKGSKKEESLDQVVNDDGTPFNNSKAKSTAKRLLQYAPLPRSLNPTIREHRKL